MPRHVVAAAKALRPYGCKVMLALLRRVRGARRVRPERRPDSVTAHATTSQADANPPRTEKRACGPVGLVYTEARLPRIAAVEAP
jgi:hypothetical protein